MRASVVVAVCCSVITSLSAAQQAIAAIRKPTNIAAQSLGSALHELAKHHEFQILYRSELVGDRYTTGAVGELTLDEALTQILSGSGLTFQYLDDKTVTILPLSSAGASAKDEATTSVNLDGQSSATTPSKRPAFSRLLRLAQAPNALAGAPASESSPESASQSSQIEEVVVTAQKRAERLIDTPQSVTVLSAESLSKLGAVQFRDFANTVPGLNFTTAGPGNTQISLRGVTTGFDVSPTTATYVDEVPYGSSTPFANSAQLGLDPALFDIERIEVLRGPQGTLYGASSMGGLIKYVQRRPDLERFGLEMQSGLSSTHDGDINYNVNGAINALIVENKVALRASAFQSHDGGYVDNVATRRKDVNQSDIYGGRVDLLAAPSENLSIRVAAFAQNISREGDATADYDAIGNKPYGERGQNRPAQEPFDQQFRVVSATIDYDFGAAELTSISSYQTVRSEFVWDLSAIYVPFLNAPPPVGFGRSYSAVAVPVLSETDKFTQEIRLSSATEGPLEWILGAFYTDESSKLAQEFALYDAAGALAPNDLFTYYVPSKYEEYAAFGDLTWKLSEKFDLTGGVRYARNEQSFSQTGAGAFGLSAPTNSAKSDVYTYLANARYHFTDNATGYLRYATGYRPGGPAYLTLDPQTGLPNGPASFDADRLKSYEAGFKSRSADRRFGIDVALYSIDWSDMQVSFNNNGFSSIHNAPGGAEIQGVELELSASPVRGLSLSGALAYQDAKLSEADSDLGAAKNERLPNVPRYTAAFNADYRLPVGNLDPTLGITVRYVDDRKSAFGATAYELPEYTSVDLRTSIDLGTFDLRFYVRNVFDELGQLSVAYPQFGGRVAIMQPRTYGLMVTAQY